MLKEIQLLKKIKEGDIKAFEALFRLFYTPLCLYGTSLTGRREAAEEIVQELFYTLWKGREAITIFSSVKSYLYGAVRNRSYLYLEHEEVKNRYRDHLLAQKQREGSTPQEQMELQELQFIITKTLDRLPERRQRIFRMHRFEGMKYAEIAVALSLSVKTVEAEMTKALQLLRKEIENYTRIK